MSWLKLIVGAWLISDRDAPVRKIVGNIFKTFLGICACIILLLGKCTGCENKRSTYVNNISHEEYLKMEEKDREIKKHLQEQYELKRQQDLQKEQERIEAEKKYKEEQIRKENERFNNISFSDLVIHVRKNRTQNNSFTQFNLTDDKNNKTLLNIIKRDGFKGFPDIFTICLYNQHRNEHVIGFINNFKDFTIFTPDERYNDKLFSSIKEKYLDYTFIEEVYSKKMEELKDEKKVKDFMLYLFKSTINVLKEKGTGKLYLYECFDLDGSNNLFFNPNYTFRLTYLPEEMYE